MQFQLTKNMTLDRRKVKDTNKGIGLVSDNALSCSLFILVVILLL